ncbi:MAG: biotin--[acetyl-CoA-carboxylase] ligase [Acidimicrobiales bacterium]
MLGPRFTDVRRFDELDSTNRYLVDEARSGAPEGLVAVADHQSAGRGRLGRRWEAPAGSNLLVSVLLRPDLPSGQRHLATAAVALAAADAATDAGIELWVKWPNDLVVPDGRKVAGVLAEAELGGSSGAPRVRPAVVVGIGINLNWPATDADLPEDLVGAATSLRQQLGHPVDREPLLSAFLAHLEPRVAALSEPEGRLGLHAELRSRCITIGADVHVQLPGTAFEGTAVELTPEGHLVVNDRGRLRTIVAGDVVHLRPSSRIVPPGPGRLPSQE